jgi:hypothetical protein
VPNPTPQPPPVFLAASTLPSRPTLLTGLCVAGAVLLAWTCWHAATGAAARAFGPGYWLYFCATTGAFGVALLGLWRLRRWALWAFPLALLLDDAVVWAMGELHPAGLALQAGLVALVLTQARAFRRRPAKPPGNIE